MSFSIDQYLTEDDLVLDHDSEKTTQIYLDSFGITILDEVSKVIL